MPDKPVPASPWGGVARIGPAIVDNPFWTYSLALYRREGVAAACLDLQDRLDLDVNVLLFCCWAGSRGRTLDRAEIERLVVATREWRDQVIVPLRTARRWLKTQDAAPREPAERLREQVKAVELAAEAVEQAILYELLPIGEGAPAPDAVTNNLRHYLAVCDKEPEPADTAALAAILCACCPALAPLEAVGLIEG